MPAPLSQSFANKIDKFAPTVLPEKNMFTAAKLDCLTDGALLKLPTRKRHRNLPEAPPKSRIVTRLHSSVTICMLFQKR